MRRTLCAAALLYCIAVLALLQIYPVPTQDFSEYHKTQVSLCGTVTEKEYKNSQDTGVYLLVTLQDVEEDEWEIQPEGKVLCRVGDGTQEAAEEADAAAAIGARVRTEGTLYMYDTATNAGEFDAREYYQILGYASFQLQSAEIVQLMGGRYLLRDALYRVRRYLAGVLDECAGEEDAPLLKAMLLGEKGSLTQEIRSLYQDSGIIHILAISGLHISVIGMGLYRLLRRMRLPAAVCSTASVAVMLLYGLMTGMSASAFRAIVMFLMRMAAMVLHRTYDQLTALSTAGILLLLQQPLYLHHSGFLFSFGTVLGIALLTPAFASRTMKALSVTLAALPVQLSCYGTFALYSVVLNLMVVPLLSVVMVGGLAVLALGTIWLPAGSAASGIVHVILLFYQALCRTAGLLPWHQVNLGAPAVWQTVLYLALLLTISVTADPLNKAVGRAAGRGRLPVFLCGHPRLAGESARIVMAAAAVLVLCLRIHTGLSLHVIDVGQGDGILLRCDDAVILIDGGSTSKSSLSQYQLTPLLEHYGVRRIDYVIITHSDTDHISGALDVILESRTHREGTAGWMLDDSTNGIVIGALCLPSAVQSARDENYDALLAAADQKNIPVIFLKEGDIIQGKILHLTCLHPEENSSYGESNAMSTVLRLEYGAFSALLTGDLEGEGEERLLEYADAEPVTLLKVAHHGSGGATSAQFLDAFRPQLAVISCGVDNLYGHPHADLLKRLEEAGVQTIYDTRTGGEIVFHTDGKRLRVTQHGGAMAG